MTEFTNKQEKDLKNLNQKHEKQPLTLYKNNSSLSHKTKKQDPSLDTSFYTHYWSLLLLIMDK